MSTYINCTYPEWAKGLAKSLWTPHVQHNPSLNCFCVWWTSLSSEHQSDQTQEQFLPSGNPSHEHLTINDVEHTKLLYNDLFTTHTCFFFSFQICTCQTCTHKIVCIVYCVFAILYIAYLYILILLSVSCLCHSVALWSFCHYNTFLVCVNIPGNKAHSDADIVAQVAVIFPSKTCSWINIFFWSWINITVWKYRLNPIPKPTRNLFLKSEGNDSWLTRV